MSETDEILELTSSDSLPESDWLWLSVADLWLADLSSCWEFKIEIFCLCNSSYAPGFNKTTLN